MHETPATARVGRATDVVTLNPIMFTELNSAAVVTQLYDHLLSLDGEMNYVARGLVKEWTIDPGGETVDFELRPGVLFHDGSELTAEDAAFTFRAALDVENGSPRRSQLMVGGQEMGFEATDRHRLRIWLPKSSASCLASLACLPILPRHLYDGALMPDHPLNTSPVGSGAFRFEQWVPGERVSIRGFEKYYAGPPRLDRIEFLAFDSVETAVEQLLAGRVDYVPNVPVEIARTLDGHAGCRVSWIDAAMVSYLAFNLDDQLLGDLRVRRAFAHAIDRQGLIQRAMDGAATVTETLVLPGTFWRADDLVPHEYDLSKAAALLDEAGWLRSGSSRWRASDTGQSLRLTIVTVAGDRTKELAAGCIAADLRQVGVDASVEAHSMGDLLRELIYPRRYQAALLALNPDPDPAFMNTFYHSAMLTPVGWNRCGYRNPRVDELLDDSLSLAHGKNARKAHLDAVQRIVSTDLPHVTLYNPRLANLVSDRLVLPSDIPPHGDDFISLARWQLAN